MPYGSRTFKGQLRTVQRAPTCPYPPDVWQRFAALDDVCDARLERLDTARRDGKLTSGRNYPRMWRVEIWRRADREGSKVIAEGADLARTLELAVRSAEGKFGGR